MQTNRRRFAARLLFIITLAATLFAAAAQAQIRDHRTFNRNRVHHRAAKRHGVRHKRARRAHGRHRARHFARHRRHNRPGRAKRHSRHTRRYQRFRSPAHGCPGGTSLIHHRTWYFCASQRNAARKAAAPAPQPPAAPPAPAVAPAGPSTVGSSPSGPGAPSGGWHVAFADAFAVPFSQDHFWKANTNSNGCCNNGNEIASESPSQVQVGSNGLELLCTASGGYVCGGVDTTHGFNWKPGGGETWAFEVVAKLPPRDLGEDPGWWSTDTAWTDEIDFFEAWEWNHEEYYAGMPVWKAKTPNAVEVSHEAYKLKTEIGNPEEGFHRYTTVIKPNNELEEFIDGNYRWSVPAPSSMNTPMMHLILTHALRVATHLSGSSSFDIRSVAVYEDGAHAGQNVEGGGVAPGTVLR